jgi:hypothetical protein
MCFAGMLENVQPQEYPGPEGLAQLLKNYEPKFKRDSGIDAKLRRRSGEVFPEGQLLEHVGATFQLRGLQEPKQALCRALQQLNKLHNRYPKDDAFDHKWRASLQVLRLVGPPGKGKVGSMAADLCSR